MGKRGRKRKLDSMEAVNTFITTNMLPVSSGCIEWQGRLNSGGYGVFRAFGKQFIVTRFLLNVSDPKIFVCHRCDNPKCVNIEHLFLGDNAVNMKDASKKRRLYTSKGWAYWAVKNKG